jgi:hypothetical protein
MRNGCVRLLLLLGSLTLAACSGYDARWRAAKAAPQRDAYAGAWQGTWKSARHAGVGDSLYCILSPTETKGDYLAQFKARWLKVFTSTHEVVLHTKPAVGSKISGAGSLPGKSLREFSGSAKLSTSIGGGTYRCDGTMTPKRMQARYDATYDSGNFVLERPSF